MNVGALDFDFAVVEFAVGLYEALHFVAEQGAVATTAKKSKAKKEKAKPASGKWWIRLTTI